MIDLTIEHYSNALTRMWQSLSAGKDLDAILHEILESLATLFCFDSASILLTEGDNLIYKASTGLSDGESRLGNHYPLADFKLMNRCLKGSSPLIVNGVHSNPDWKPDRPDSELISIKSWLGVPLRTGDCSIGILCLESQQPDFFSDNMLTPVLLFAEQAALATWHAGVNLESRRQAEKTRVLLEVSHDLSSSLDLDTVLNAITNKANRLLTFDTTAVYLLDEQKQLLAVVSAAGREASIIASRKIKPGSGIIGSIALSGKSEIINNTNKDPRAVHIEGTADEEEGEKLMGIPLLARERILGVMVIWRSASEPLFTEDDLSFCTALASHAAMAIYNAQLYGQAGIARQEAENANRSKTRFLATMSHELRTPLNSIINFAYLLKEGVEGPVAEGQNDMLGRIENSGHYLLSLINDILDLAKIEAGKMELFLEPVNPAAIAKETCTLLGGLCRDKKLQLRAIIPEKLPSMYGDKTRIRQILLNLLGNSVKFTDTGFVRLELKANEQFVEFLVQDSGRGIAEADLPRVFTEFSCLDNGRKTCEGTGLGLYIVKHLVELHQGTIELKSVRNEGTSIRFSIPRIREDPESGHTEELA